MQCTDIDQTLTHHFGWKKKAIGVIGLSLTPDNLRVDNGAFITRGSLEFKDKKIAANLIWPAARATTNLVLSFPAADEFIFENGGLWSNSELQNNLLEAIFLKRSNFVLGHKAIFKLSTLTLLQIF